MFLSHEMPTRLRALSLDKRTNIIARTPIQCLKNRACTDPPLFAIPGEVQNNDIQSGLETDSSVNENQKDEKENVKEKEAHNSSADTPLMEEIEEPWQQTDAEESRSNSCNGEKQGIEDVTEFNSKINKERSHIYDNSTNTGQVIDKIESADNLRRTEVVRLLLDLPEDLLSYLLLTFLGDVFLQDLCRISLTCHTLHRLVKPFLKTLKIRIVCTILYFC